MPTYKGIDYLRKKLAAKQTRVMTRYQYFDMKNSAKDLSGVIPKEFNWLRAVTGWCAKAVTSISDRIVLEGFRNDGLGIGEIFDRNSMPVLSDSSVISALISSCCFIYIHEGADKYPQLEVIDGGNATGVIDTVTRMLKEGYAVLDRDDQGKPTIEGYFTPEATYIYYNGKLEEKNTYTNHTSFPLLVPVIYRPDPTRPFGHSRISRTCMDLTDSAMRTLKRSEVSAEFYSIPQKYVVGVSQDAQPYEKWKATISSFLQYSKDEDGDSPKLGQFQQQSMAPYNDQLKTIASMFAGETGLTLDDLGFSTANPSTPEAIRASHESLRLTARKAQRDFSIGFLNAGFLAACLRDNYAYDLSVLAQTKVKYEPIFEPDAAQLSGMGDAVNKIQQSFPDYFDEDKLHDLTGL